MADLKLMLFKEAKHRFDVLKEYEKAHPDAKESIAFYRASFIALYDFIVKADLEEEYLDYSVAVDKAKQN